MRGHSLMIFHRDLRLKDNIALVEAAKTHKPLLFLYVFQESRQLGKNSASWLEASLERLCEAIHERGGQLLIRHGALVDETLKLVESARVEEVFWNRTYEPTINENFRILKSSLEKRGVSTMQFQGNLLMEPDSVKPVLAPYFQVFTPFWKRCLTVLDPPLPQPIPKWVPGVKFSEQRLVKRGKVPPGWEPGERGAEKALQHFLQNGGIDEYMSSRDVLDSETSRLSPHLHFGEVSVNEVWHASQHCGANPDAIDSFLRELGFREFSYHLLHHFPHLPKKNFRTKFDSFKWGGNEEFLERWKEGKTGYPVVDAGMRQLRETGWMHNRSRMIVASFLTKDLLIPWTSGEEWFWELLVDADLALNAFNWQWVAGCGADAAPYFRIFNPTLQQKKFDPDGNYVRRWVPELDTSDYPNPIVDHATAKKKALEYYQKIK